MGKHDDKIRNQELCLQVGVPVRAPGESCPFHDLWAFFLPELPLYRGQGVGAVFSCPKLGFYLIRR